MMLREKENTTRLEKISVPFPAFLTKEAQMLRVNNELFMIDTISRGFEHFGENKIK